ncbi:MULTISPECIES: hypothetical protein [Azospirillum]|uniref:Uncharacterized protein n=1 Tax=Azospirillum endophyticum TaxID=2800326 RepID=A0ABS1F4Q9_9PROT|nr:MULTISPECIES: hypothetical protein [Azospirillum]MBK1838405.1 hypothetical protein [Azospirillum endophyticum]SMH61429.1 hypothetical protein SAMN02982994_5825 [Azospirillum lipoferum]
MMRIVRDGTELINCIEADAVLRVLQPDTAPLTNRLCRLLRDAVHAWSHGEHSPAAREQIENLLLVAGSLGYQVGLECTDVFTAVGDLDAAVQGGLALMPHFDRPVLRLALQPKLNVEAHA